MKELTIIRHAQAEPGGGRYRDKDRPLSAHGRRQAASTAAQLRRARWRPERIMASPAVRTTDTAAILAEGTGCPPDILKAAPFLYSASFASLLQHIAGFPEACTHIALVGHNPMVSALAAMLSNHAVDFMPTACAACLSFDTDQWQALPRLHGALVWVAPGGKRDEG